MTRREDRAARLEHAVESGLLTVQILAADLDEPRQLVVAFADRDVEIRPRARDALFRHGEVVVRRAEPENGGDDRGEDDEAEKHPPPRVVSAPPSPLGRAAP